MDELKELEGFRPTMLGTSFFFEEGSMGMVTDETEDSIFIESDFFTGWMTKAAFFEALGVED